MVINMRMIFIFIDGLGIGERDSCKNPVYCANAPNIRRILEDPGVFAADASLGVPGLPQSATGQTAIFTGENAPKALGRHLNAQPTITLKNIINRNNLFKDLMSMGLKVTNSNVYRDEYLINMLNPVDRRLRPSVTTVMSLSAGVEFRTIKDLKNGNGVYHDITGRILCDKGYDVNVITPVEAAGRLCYISRNFDFTLFEHFMTDIIGHSVDMERAVKHIELLDAFLGEVIRLADFRNDIIFITSDHGNIEDMTVKTHTMNKVPVAILGKIPDMNQIDVESLLDITHLVKKIFKTKE